MSTAYRIPDQTSGPLGVRVLQRLSSFPIMLASLLVVLAVTTVRSRFDDPDMWWHLKMGEIIWTTHVIPTTDIFSFTTGHHAYIPHEWLSQLLIYGAYRLGGYSGLMVWLCLLTSAILVAGYGLCCLYSGNAKVAFLGALIIWLFGTVGFSIRPQMIGYLLLIVELILLHLGRTRNPRWFFALPPLFAIWVNCHGSFFLGIVLAGVSCFSSYFTFQSGPLVAARWDLHRRNMLAGALTLSVLALFVNPVGVGLIRYPLETMLVPSVAVGAVAEWQPLQFGDPRGFALLGVLACIFMIVTVRRSELHWRELLVLALGAWLAASHRRLLFPFGIMAAPILSRLLATLWDRYDAKRDRHFANAGFVSAALLIALWAFPSRQSLTIQIEEHSPVKAVDFIRTHHLAGPMLNEWDDGGYLIWAAPEYPDFIDGRADVFDQTGVVAEFGKWATLQTAPGSMLDKYQINFCLLQRDSPMTFVLPLLPNWRSVYSDNLSVIFVRGSSVAPQSEDADLDRQWRRGRQTD